METQDDKKHADGRSWLSGRLDRMITKDRYLIIAIFCLCFLVLSVNVVTAITNWKNYQRQIYLLDEVSELKERIAVLEVKQAQLYKEQENSK